MHRRGNPETMQTFSEYHDLMKEIKNELGEGIETARIAGISHEQMVIDPGVGFSKTAEQNFELLGKLSELSRDFNHGTTAASRHTVAMSELQEFNFPVLIGPSRKSFIASITNKSADDRIFGTVAACVLGFMSGAKIFRVHDVKAVKEALLISESIFNHQHGVAR